MVPGCLVCPGGEGGARVDVLPGTVGGRCKIETERRTRVRGRWLKRVARGDGETRVGAAGQVRVAKKEDWKGQTEVRQVNGRRGAGKGDESQECLSGQASGDACRWGRQEDDAMMGRAIARPGPASRAVALRL